MDSVCVVLQTGNSHLAADDVRASYEASGHISVYGEWHLVSERQQLMPALHTVAGDLNQSSRGETTVNEGESGTGKTKAQKPQLSVMGP